LKTDYIHNQHLIKILELILKSYLSVDTRGLMIRIVPESRNHKLLDI